MTTITTELPEESSARLQALATDSGISPEEPVREAIERLLSSRRGQPRWAAAYVIEKNAELDRRLAR